MQVRGSVIKSIDKFVASRHADQYENWKSKLSPKTIDIFNKTSDSEWYPVEEAAILPTEVMCNMFYPSSRQGAWASGSYSAEVALTGIYKIFVLVSSPAFLLKRASRIIATFYDPTDLKVVDSTNQSMIIQFTQLPVKHELIEYRIAGWMEKALEICGCKNLSLVISKSMAKGDPIFETVIHWD